MGTLTVRENLAFSANLRLSRKEYSSSDKEMRVDSVIQELGLKDCADTKVKDFSLVMRNVENDLLCWCEQNWRSSLQNECVKELGQSHMCFSHTKTISNNAIGRSVRIYCVTVGTVCVLYMGLFRLRLGRCFCVVFLVERRRGAASVWSSSPPPLSCTWMSPPQAWTPTLPTPSWNYCRSTTRSYQIYLLPLL